jgi:hypothetical protein
MSHVKLKRRGQVIMPDSSIEAGKVVGQNEYKRILRELEAIRKN